MKSSEGVLGVTLIWGKMDSDGYWQLLDLNVRPCTANLCITGDDITLDDPEMQVPYHRLPQRLLDAYP